MWMSWSFRGAASGWVTGDAAALDFAAWRARVDPAGRAAFEPGASAAPAGPPEPTKSRTISIA
jgi:hypothetical protein